MKYSGSKLKATRMMMPEPQIKIEEFLALRKAEGLRIDPSTAEVTWRYGQTLDPYGGVHDLPEEGQQVGRQYFARAPGSDVWVEFGDLPDKTRTAFEHAISRNPELYDEDLDWLP